MLKFLHGYYFCACCMEPCCANSLDCKKYICDNIVSRLYSILWIKTYISILCKQFCQILSVALHLHVEKYSLCIDYVMYNVVYILSTYIS